MGKKKVFIVDDQQSDIELHTLVMQQLDWDVQSSSEPQKALDEILEAQPQLILVDLMMPGLDGLELCRMIREHEELDDATLVIVSAKPYEYDRKRALDRGADGYLIKPFTKEKILDFLQTISNIKLTFWGVRGTLPITGQRSLKYGGNTSCISIELPGKKTFIFDAGSGIKHLSDHLMRTHHGKFQGHIFITHPHWDHINAFPFFVPLYIPGNHVTVHGPSQGGDNIEKIMSDQMDGVYFPVTVKEFGAFIKYNDLNEGDYEIDGVEVSTKLLTHPGNCLGYRIRHGGKTVCYITDNELYLENTEGYSYSFWEDLKTFIQGCDILIHDTTYFDLEYKSKVHWGHSCLSQVVKLAHEAEIKKLYLFHHDPDHGDEDIDRKVEIAEKQLKNLSSTTEVTAAVEQEPIIL